MLKPYRGHIDNWVVWKGMIYGGVRPTIDSPLHPTTIRTSSVKVLNEDIGQVETQNSRYTLGAHAQRGSYDG